jgi:nucleoside-diphosphate-sugar epimerase
VDAIVHCALAGGPDEYAVNVAGTRRWLEEGRGRGVGLQIFLSSLSATAEARSGYGRAKFELEQAFVAADQVVFRLGVVVGDGGMFARIREASRKAPVVPLLDNGAQLIYVLGIDYLCAVLRDCILGDGEGLRGRPWNLHQPRPYTLRQVTEAINRHYRYRRLLLPIPSRPILLALQVLERLPHIHVPISSANVQGLRQQGRQHIPSDFDRFGYPEESLERLVARVQD